MKKLLPALLSLLITSTLIAQDSLLRQFKFRNVNYRAITLSPNGSIQFSRSELIAGRNENHGGGASFTGNYYAIKSNDRSLFTFNAFLNGSFSRQKLDNVAEDYKIRYSQFAPHLILSGKRFTENNFFTELAADGRTEFNDNKNIGAAEAHSRDRSSALAITAGIGKGRLENVTDMQNALWLNEALTAEGRLSRTLSAEELLALGRTITIANNTRVLDARRRTRFVLETIDRFLQDKGLVSTADIKYFSNLNDIVFFAINEGRLAGTERFIRLTPAVRHVRSGYKQTITGGERREKALNRSADLSLGINSYRPVNLHHQNNIGASVLLRYLSQDYDLKEFLSGNLASQLNWNSEYYQAGLNAFFEHSVYPNTRTILTARLSGEAGYHDYAGDTFYGKADLYGMAGYFISYRTRFTAGIGAVYRKNVYDITGVITLLPTSIHLYANAGLMITL